MMNSTAEDFGKAEIDARSPVIAGSFQTVRWTYTAGHPIDDSGYVKIAFRFAGDFGVPQFTAPREENYSAIVVSGNCRIEPRWDPKGHTRPWGRTLYLKVTGGFLNTGETVTVVFGDRSQGSPGWQVQTFCEQTFAFRTFADPYASYRFKELPHSPEMEIVPGPPVRAVCVAPSVTAVGQEFSVGLRLEDRWGNAVRKADRYTVTAPPDEQVFTVRITDEETGLSAESNPVQAVSGMGFSGRSFSGMWWADFHGQSEETIGSGTIEEYFTYARDCSLLDIAAHQGNDFQVTDAFWEKINRTTEAFHVPGSFITFPGYEWSGNTPLGGDRNIYHRDEGGPIWRSSHELLPGEQSVYDPAPTADELFRRLNPDTSFAFAHVGGRYADIAMHREGLETAMEIHSAWGTFEWLLTDALQNGYTVGICANSDGHKCRPGASYPGAAKFGSYGGLTCVLAPALTRDAVFRAMHRRHFYATTGCRLLLSVTASSAAESVNSDTVFLMGDVVTPGIGDLTMHISCHGTAPIVSLELYDGEELLEQYLPGEDPVHGNRLQILWSGAEVRGRARHVCWDGFLQLMGNRIRKMTSVNFWNPDRQPQLFGDNRAEWTSVTTGGTAGLILELDHGRCGQIQFRSAQLNADLDIGTLMRRPAVTEAGGLQKQLTVRLLPDRGKAETSVVLERTVEQPAAGKRRAVYVKVVQEDGHMAWSSPIYITG